MSDAELRPDQRAVAECLRRGRRAAEQAGLDLRSIITSRDVAALRAKDSLRVETISEGFQKYQLPVHFDGVSMCFDSVGEPGTRVPEHAHDGDIIRFIAGGSIIQEGKELIAGDWVYIPAEQPYSFDVGPHGAHILAGYSQH